MELFDPHAYSDRRVIVTGCASGIGAATAHALAERGARVIGFDSAGASLPGGAFVPVDLGDPRRIDEAMATVDGPIDALFNCAGVSPTRDRMEIFAVNLLGTRHLTGRVVERMGRGGAIVSVSSNGGLRWRSRIELLRDFIATASFEEGLAWLSEQEAGFANAYSFAKEAITVWTMTESARLIARGIRINCSSPGAVQTAMLAEIERTVPASAIDATIQPIGRRSSAEEQAWPLLFLNSDAARYINGVDLPVDGGFAATVALDC